MLCHRKQALLALVICAGIGAGQAAPWKFLVYGDSRGSDPSSPINTTILNELVKVTTTEKPAFVLVPGDLVYSGNLAAFQQWSNLMAPVYRAKIGVYPIIGNHDSADVASFINVFGPSIPDNGPSGEINRTYALTYSNALILALDVYVTNHTLRVNQNWVNAVLATNRQQHVFAMSHVPAFKVQHTDCLDDYATERNVFWNSLSNAHCRMYFCGHDHFYDHTRLDDGDGNSDNDVHQFVVGTAGAPLTADGAYNGVNGLWTPTRIYHEAQYGYLSVQIDGATVKSTWYHRTANKTYTATSEGLGYLASPPAPTILVSYSGGRLVLSWPGTGTLQASRSISGSYTNVPGATSPYVITNFAAPGLFYRVAVP